MKKNKTIKSILLAQTADFKAFREADKIIAYLNNKDEKSNLPANLKTKLDRYLFIHGLRMRYKQHSYIIGHLGEFYKRNERQARYDIAEAEYIFGKAIQISRQYELAFLLQMSIKNVELAMTSKDVKLITMALKMHHEIIGPEQDMSEMPDATKFEQHVYNMILPPGIGDLLKNMVSSGALDLSKVMPSKMLQIKASDGK